MGKWTEEQKEYAINNFGKVSILAMAKKIGKNIPAVRSYLYAQGLKTHSRTFITESEKKFMEDNFNKMAYAEMAKELKKSESSIKVHLRSCELRKRGINLPKCNQDLIAEIQKRMISTGLSLEELSKLSGLSPHSISWVKEGDGNPALCTVMRVAKILKLKIVVCEE
jgi:DNA-binding phage protein